MTKVFVLSDDGVPSGFGRISMEINTRLAKRGYTIHAASIQYDGLLPAAYNGERLAYDVSALGGRAWLEEAVKVIHAVQPDVVLVVQDAPYAQGLRSIQSIDWTRVGFAVITPVDGAPIYPAWIDTLKRAGGVGTISQFGVETMRRQGVEAQLVRPGVNQDVFYPLTADRRAEVRAALNIAPDAFVVGSMCMNQGRKAISLMVKAFMDFAADKPTARYLMDMDAQSPAGWDIPALCQQHGWDASKIIFRADAMRAGIVDLRERYGVLDAHMVISHREGYGLPLAEAQACGVPSIALDYCSGTEICGDGRGVLIKALDYGVPGTWGGAVDKFPDMDDLREKLQALYSDTTHRAYVAQRGRAWAQQQTWDAAAINAQAVIDKARRTVTP